MMEKNGSTLRQSSGQVDSPRRRSVGVTFFGYFGLIYGLFGAGQSLLLRETIGFLLSLAYFIFSYNLLKFRNWARLALLIINTIWAVLFFIILFVVFVWMPGQIAGSFIEGFKLTFNELIKVFVSALPQPRALVTAALLTFHIYIFGFPVYFTRPKVKRQFLKQSPEDIEGRDKIESKGAV